MTNERFSVFNVTLWLWKNTNDFEQRRAQFVKLSEMLTTLQIIKICNRCTAGFNSSGSVNSVLLGRENDNQTKVIYGKQHKP